MWILQPAYILMWVTKSQPYLRFFLSIAQMHAFLLLLQQQHWSVQICSDVFNSCSHNKHNLQGNFNCREKKTNHFWWLVIWCWSCNAPSLHCMARIYQGKIASHYILQASPSTLFLLLFAWFAFSTFAMRAATSYMWTTKDFENV